MNTTITNKTRPRKKICSQDLAPRRDSAKLIRGRRKTNERQTTTTCYAVPIRVDHAATTTDLRGVLGEEAKGVPVADGRLGSDFGLEGHLHRRGRGLRGGQRRSLERAERSSYATSEGGPRNDENKEQTVSVASLLLLLISSQNQMAHEKETVGNQRPFTNTLPKNMPQLCSNMKKQTCARERGAHHDLCRWRTRVGDCPQEKESSNAYLRLEYLHTCYYLTHGYMQTI